MIPSTTFRRYTWNDLRARGLQPQSSDFVVGARGLTFAFERYDPGAPAPDGMSAVQLRQLYEQRWLELSDKNQPKFRARTPDSSSNGAFGQRPVEPESDDPSRENDPAFNDEGESFSETEESSHETEAAVTVAAAETEPAIGVAELPPAPPPARGQKQRR